MATVDPTDYERELLAAVEVGSMPPDVYADWLEEEGDERAVGARWLADRGKFPRRLPVGWWWPSLRTTPSGLPRVVRRRMPRSREPYCSFVEAYLVGVEVTSSVLSGQWIDEEAELQRLFHIRHDAAEAYARELHRHDDPRAEAVMWLAAWRCHPERFFSDPPYVRRTYRWWRCGRYTDLDRDCDRNHDLPTAVFERLRTGVLETKRYGSGMHSSCTYDAIEACLKDAVLAVSSALAADAVDWPDGEPPPPFRG